MKELTKLSNQDLHQKMLSTAERERELSAQMISMIEEAGRRKFFLDLGHATLYDYLTVGLKYSAGAAMRRINAARIFHEIPEVKERIVDGTLSLTNLSQAEHFFRNEAKNSPGSKTLSTEEKRAVLNQVVNKSTREAEKVLMAMSSAPEQLKEDRIKPLTPELTQITFKANAEFMSQLEELKGLLAHQMPGASLGELMAEAVKVALVGLKKRKFKVRDSDMSAVDQKAGSNVSEGSKTALGGTENVESDNVEPEAQISASAAVSRAGNKTSRSIPASVQREVFLRDAGRCVAINSHTGRICGSLEKVEFDHYPIPWAMGGPSIAANLRLACADCNRLHAVQSYGRATVAKSMREL